MRDPISKLLVVAIAIGLSVAPHGCSGTESGNPRCRRLVCPAPMRVVGLEGDLPGAEWRVEGTLVAIGGPQLSLTGTEVDPASCGSLSETTGASFRGELTWDTTEASLDASGDLHVVYDDPPGDPPMRNNLTPDGGEAVGYHVRALDLTLTRERQLTATLTLVIREAPDGGTPPPEMVVTLSGPIAMNCLVGETMATFPVAGPDAATVLCGGDGSVRPPCRDTSDDSPDGCG